MSLVSELLEGLRIAWEAVRANKLRSVLTTLGIIIGVVTVTLMAAAIEGLNQAFLRSISAIGADVLFVQKFPWFNEEPWWTLRNRRDITFADMRALERQSKFAEAVTAETYGRAAVKYENYSAPAVQIVATTDQGAIVGGLDVAQGRFLTAPEVDGARPVCVLGHEVADNFFPFESPLGKRVSVNGHVFEVVGVLKKRGKFLGMESLDNQVILPITRFVQQMAWRPNVEIKVKVRDLRQLDEAREELRGIMRKLRRVAPGEPDDFAINEQRAFINTFQKVGGVIASVGLFITGLALFVGGIGIMNIMFVSVAERTREIGLRKALGARPRAILVQFLIEAALICLIGGLVGLGIAWGTTLLVSKWLPATVSIPVVGLALGVSLATGLLAGFFPAWRAARMDPVDALRVE
jgi:putative ABC transport system permease protein